MIRTISVIFIVIGTLNHICIARDPGSLVLNVIKQNLSSTIDITKGIVQTTNTGISPQIVILHDNVSISQITSIAQGLVPDLLQIVSAVGSSAGNIVQTALQSVSNAVNAISNAVLSAIPLLNNVVYALTQILADIVGLVDSVLQLVLNLLGSLTNNLQITLQNVLVSRE